MWRERALVLFLEMFLYSPNLTCLTIKPEHIIIEKMDVITPETKITLDQLFHMFTL